MEAFITYDVSARQDDVKSGMVKLGYSDNWQYLVNGTQKTLYLPNTSLWMSNTELQKSYEDITKVIDGLNATKTSQETIRLLRCVSVSRSPWYGIPGTGQR
jgi:hypothetical protein